MIEAIPDYAGKSLKNLVDILIRLIVRNYKQYPVQLSAGNFTVVMCGKEPIDSAGNFECFRIDSTFKDAHKTKLCLPSKSGPIVIAGSGKTDFEGLYSRHQASENTNKSTSRDVFHAFYQTIKQGKNPTVGPIPQIVSVLLKPNTGGAHCGVVVDDRRYISGQLVDRDIAPEGLQWFNDKFEITNPHTKRREHGAQIQPPFRC